MKNKLQTWSKVAAIYFVILVMLEGAGQLLVKYLESKRPTGVEAEFLMSYQEPLVGFALKKNLTLKLAHWSVTTDQWGFRTTKTIEKKKPINEKRIFLVGGSTVFGWGVNDDQSFEWYFDWHLEHWKKQNPQSKDVHVRFMNAGVPWYASWHEASTIFFKIMEFEPDAIIVLNGLNDTALGISSSWAPVYMGFLDRPSQLAFEKKSRGGSSTFVDEIIQLSPTLRYFQARYNERKSSHSGSFRPQVWEQYLSISYRIQNLAKASGVPVYWYFQPVQAVDKPITHYELTHNGTSMANKEFEEAFRKQYLLGETQVLASSLPVKSLKSIFKDNQKTIYLDGLHYNSLGNEIISREIFNHSVVPLVQKWSEKNNRISGLPIPVENGRNGSG